MAPETLGGRYELRGVLGQGGMSLVRDGWDTRLDRPVAVKLLHPVFTSEPVNRLRFESEARAAAAMSHPHIVAVHDSGEHDGTPYIVMERLPGRTLADLIAGGPLPQAQARSILDDVLSALAAAHAAGTLHRDIKPANILFTESGHTKVADFGIAKSVESPHTMTGQIVGTMAYLSVERIAGAPATAADDLYALGVVGYETLTGHRPFPQENLVELARAIGADEPTPLRVARPDVAPGLAAVVERAMARDPRWRFDSADAMRAALASGLSEPALARPRGLSEPAPARPPTKVLASPLPEPATMLVPPRVRRGRARLLLGVAAAVAATLIAVAALIAESTSSTPVPEPASTSTSVSAPVSTAVTSSPPPPTTPAEADQGNPPRGRGENGKGPKPKKGDDD